MQGKVCMVTGASSGIGRVTARELAKQGATVVMVCRDAQRGEAARAEIQQASGNPAVELLLADLASQAAIRQLAERFKARHARLDVLVNNAGGIFGARRVTVDGLEQTFAVNHLAYFLLTALLLDVLKASAPARIVNVSSLAHRSGTIRFDDLQGERRYGGARAYSQSKLANVLFTYELARRLKGTGVTATCLHPGAVASNFGASGSPLVRFAVWLARPFFVTEEQGAATSVYLASSPEVAGVTGKYFVNKAPKASSKASNDPAMARRLWEVSAQLTGVEPATP